jgi:glycosyltransferase involved in cell wall biosynthesis
MKNSEFRNIVIEGHGIIDVLFVVTTLGPGGTEYYVENLATQLKRLGVRVVVLADSEPSIRRQNLESEGVPTYILGVDSSWSRNEYKKVIDSFLRRNMVRIVHANMWMRENWLRQVVNDHHIPMIVTDHHTTPTIRLRDRLGLNRIPFYLYRRRAILSKGQIATISISDLSLKHFRERYGNAPKATRVYCGGPGSNILADPKARGTAPKVVWLGSMNDRKRPLLALKVFSHIYRMFPECTLLMIGGGELLPRVQKIAATFPLGVVEFAGFVEEVYSHLASGQVLLHTSAIEGTPTAVREAMSASLPVVATNAGAMHEIILHERTGLIVPVDDLKALVSALARLIEDPELRLRYGKAGRTHFEERFALDRMIDETISAYKVLTGIDVIVPNENF